MALNFDLKRCQQEPDANLMLLDALRTLNPAGAEFGAVPKEQCMKQTRVDVLESIIAHFSELGTSFVWLRGSPGTRKTAVAKSLCEELDNNQRLAASFFFDKNRGADGVDSTARFISTLAFRLGNVNRVYR